MHTILRNNGKQVEKPSSKEANREREEVIPEVIKSEVNLLVLPFFALWDKDTKRRTETEYRTVITRGLQKLEIAWIVTSSPRYGYPGPFDREVHKAIEQIISELPLPIQNPIPIGSLYNLCKRMGINKFGGSQYKKIRKALERITTTSIKSEGTFYSKEKEEWIEDIFHLYERVIFKGKKLPNGEIADTNYLFLNSWYLDNINAHYVKPINWDYYRLLETPVAQRLYELLSVKFYGLLVRGGKFISYKYSTLCSLLPIVRQKYLSKAKEVLEPAHKKLKETGFFKSWDWEELPQEGKEKDWLIRYYPGRRAREEIERFRGKEQLEFMLPPPKDEEIIESRVELSAEDFNVVEQLTQRGITAATAKMLAKSHPAEHILRQIEVFDWLKERKSLLVERNPGGFLRKAIEEDYQPPKEYLKQQERKEQERKNEDKRERWRRYREELIGQGVTNWDKVSPERRIEGRLSFWIASETMNGRKPTLEQIEIKKQELIDGLPQTDEERWEYLSQNYPDDPPEDFE
ncbi:MAG: replication initiator protein A [Rhodocyclaceae bacterium]|nr:replication initiator protein A [Rhodocyclaceae bacterium]